MTAGKAAGWIVYALWLVILPGLAGAAQDGVAPGDQAGQSSARHAEPDSQQMRRELERLGSVADGIGLALAACHDTPQCVEGFSQQEIVRAIYHMQQRIDGLQQSAAKTSGDAGASRQTLLKGYQALRARYAHYLQQARTVLARVDTQGFDKHWADVFEARAANARLDSGPQVPAANRSVELKRFQDADQPLPLD